MPMSVEEALGTLIRMANPYTTGAPGTLGFVATTIDPSDIHMEEDNYPTQWTFKGLTQNIKRALRIQYEYDKLDKNGVPLGYKVTEHLLVGFAGSNGP